MSFRWSVHPIDESIIIPENQTTVLELFNQPCFLFLFNIRRSSSSPPTQREFFKYRLNFYEDPFAETCTMLSTIGIPREMINNLALNLVSSFSEMAFLPRFIQSKVLAFFIPIVFLESVVDEEELVLQQVMLESANDFVVPTIPATRSSIEALEEVKVSQTSLESCPICLEDLKEQKVLCMPCSHLFHKDCIVLWLETSHFCPLCRFAMPV
ncbi:hypothetical protein UlMin_045871 [Ulmus minor]